MNDYHPDMEAIETVLKQAGMMANYINKKKKTYKIPPRGELGMILED
jgi:hypothetical protein